MIKAMIVDDNKASVELLKWLIHEHSPQIGQLEYAYSVDEALEKMETYKPDLLFLDIQMPVKSGFDLLSVIENWKFEVIFTTAYDNYAIQAIKFSALDYLLKPIDETELVKSIERYITKQKTNSLSREMYKNFIHNIESKNSEEFKLALTGVNDIKYVAIKTIVRLQADRNYTRFYFTEDTPFLSSKTLKEFENILKEFKFLRVHKSHLVNPLFISNYDRSGFITLSNGEQVEVSRRKRDLLLNL